MEKIWTKKPIYTCYCCGEALDGPTDLYCDSCTPFIAKNLDYMNFKFQQLTEQLLGKTEK